MGSKATETITCRDKRWITKAGRQSLQAALDHIRRYRCCAYENELGQRCSCKFGVIESDDWPHRHEFGNGCPELYEAMAMLRAMTDAEWERVARRAFGDKNYPKRKQRKRRTKAAS